jgi:hypothetical protein
LNLSATAEPRLTTPRSEPALRPTLRQPLHHLKAGIRRYVILESLALLVIVATGWALASLVFDWGILFQLFSFDYLRDAGTAAHVLIRGGFFVTLLTLVGWVLVRYLALRLAKPISETDLSVLLERKFGKELGDRLVTAVELSDAEAARRAGYSWTMVEATTDEAESRLRTVRVGDVLNQSRLAKRLTIAVLCVVGCAAGVVLATEVVGTWAERNLLFINLPWPRSVVLELVGFPNRSRAIPFGNELKVTVRSAKWAVADGTSSEGWRPLRWEDVRRGRSQHSWELEGVSAEALYDVLPPEWRQLTLDQVEARVSESAGGVDRQLGLALIRKLQEYLWEHRQDKKTLPPELAAFLPEKLRQMTVDQQKVVLEAAAALSRQDAERIAAGLTQLRPALGDAALSLINLWPASPGHPLPCMAALQKFGYERDQDIRAFAMPENERVLLPAEWREKLAVRDLAKRLKTFSTEESAELLGKAVAERVRQFFASLEERAGRSKLGTRKTFRQLNVPDKITLEFENIVEAEERSRGRAKRGQPELKRVPGGNEYQYDFKKVERPMRLRAYAGSLGTPWHRVDVKPLPSLSRLVRYHDEPAYLHASLSRVQVGPLVLPLDGEESRGHAPLGSRVWFEGESQKPLRAVRAITDNPADAPAAEHKEGESRFVLRAKPSLAEDLRFKLEFEDMDGIKAVRNVLLMLTPDKAPEFVKAQFEAVNRKFVTPKAILPLSVFVRDDVALLGVEYEVSIQRNDRSANFDVRLPFRLYSPLRFYQREPGGTRFEQLEDVALGRIAAQLAGEGGVDPFQNLGALPRLPAGLFAAVSPLHVGLRREFNHDYVDRSLFGPVINRDEDEFLDTLLLRPAAGKPMDQPFFETPYRMVVRLAARDNRMREDASPSVPQHQESHSNETFEFNVVSEQDVILETGRREEDLRDRFEELIASLKKVRSSLKRIRDELDTPSQAKDDEMRRAVSDAADATKALATIRNGLDEKVLREFRQVFRELALNRVDERILDRVDGKICKPLATLLQQGQSFARLEETVDLLSRRLDAERGSTPKTVLNEPVLQADRVLAQLDAILQDMRKLIEFNEALRVLRDLINNEQKVVEEMRKLIQKKLKDDLDN